MKKLILAAALLAPLAGSAMAQDASGFYGTPEREITSQAPRGVMARPHGHHYSRPDLAADETGRQPFTPGYFGNN